MKRIFLILTLLSAALRLPAESDAAANATAVLDFTAGNLSGKDWTVGLADYVEMALQQEGVPTLERRQIRMILGERDLQSRVISSGEAWQTAKLPGMAFFVSGNVSQTEPDHFALTLSVVQAGTATVKATFTKRGSYPADWLEAIHSLAQDASAQVRTPTPSPPVRSGSESLTWLPEAALPFFKGLEYYSQGDFARAIPNFRDAAAKAGRFDQARLWEARACRRAGFAELAEFAVKPVLQKPIAPTNLAQNLPVVAVIGSENIPAAARSAFVQRLTQSGRFTVFDPSSIAATTRETDLQLTGQITTPLNGSRAWLIVDSIVVLAVHDGTLAAQQCDLLSGEPMRQAHVSIRSGQDDLTYDRLAKEFLQSQPAETATPPVQADASLTQALEPDPHDSPETVFAKTLNLVKGNPNNARYWVALADCYGEWDSKMWLLDQAIKAVERDKAQPDAPFWLASALWRKRQMSSWAWLYSHSWSYSEHPLTNDFARLLAWFPHSPEATTAMVEETRESGTSIYAEPKDKRFMAGVFAGAGSVRRLPDAVPPAAPRFTEAQRLSRLKELVRRGDNAKAWQVADSLLEAKEPGIAAEAHHAYDELLKRLVEEDQQMKTFNAAMKNGHADGAWKIGLALLPNILRKERLALIAGCGGLLKAKKDVDAWFQFVFTQAEQYKEDFDVDPATGAPLTGVVDFTLEGNPARAVRWTTSSIDLDYARLMGDLADEMQGEGRPDLSAQVFEAIRSNDALPSRNRLTAACDLALAQYQQGNTFAALDLLKALLQQTQGTGIPIARKHTWSSETVEGAAFNLLRKIRLYTDDETDFTRCCGEPSPVAKPCPQMMTDMNQLFDQLWQSFKSGTTGDGDVRQKLLAQKNEVMPVLLYKLWRRQDAQQLLIFCSEMGTNAAAAVPYLPRYVCYNDDFPEINNALEAFGGIGKPAACATPFLILAAEGTTSVFNAEYALRKVGPAPKSAMPYLARLLYHPNPGVRSRAARAVIASARLEANQFSKQDMIGSLRNWWENEGSKEEWRD